jgi:osmotically-inducible protein OsmY
MPNTQKRHERGRRQDQRTRQGEETYRGREEQRFENRNPRQTFGWEDQDRGSENWRSENRDYEYPQQQREEFDNTRGRQSGQEYPQTSRFGRQRNTHNWGSEYNYPQSTSGWGQSGEQYGGYAGQTRRQGSYGFGSEDEYDYGEGGRGMERNMGYEGMQFDPNMGQRWGNRGMTGNFRGQFGTMGGSQDWQTQRSRGMFAGRGPQGYKRSDERITEDINEDLTQDPDLDASNITVETKNGEVTLKGTVPDRDSKRRAEELAEACSGVKDVQNQLRVKREEESESESRRDKTEDKRSRLAS